MFISKLNKFNENLLNCENVVNKVKLNYNVDEFYNNSIEISKINLENNNFDVNEDKQRQCYKQLKCFWPKCRYSCDGKSNLKKHISHHSNKKPFNCDECNQGFHQISNLLKHKGCIHSTDRPFICNQINCNKTFKIKSHLTKHKLRHTSVKSFGCDKCDKRFKTYLDLSRDRQ